MNPLKSICAAGWREPWHVTQYVARNGRTVREKVLSNAARESAWPNTQTVENTRRTDFRTASIMCQRARLVKPFATIFETPCKTK